MLFDATFILAYLTIILVIGIRSRQGGSSDQRRVFSQFTRVALAIHENRVRSCILTFTIPTIYRGFYLPNFPLQRREIRMDF